MEIHEDELCCPFCIGGVDNAGKPIYDDEPLQGPVELCFACGRLSDYNLSREPSCACPACADKVFLFLRNHL